MKVETANKTITYMGDMAIVSWKHLRKGKLSTGGETKCQIKFIDNGKVVRTTNGNAQCSNQDNYNKNTGRKISMARTLSFIHRDSRKIFWDTYFKEIGQ